MPRPELRVLTVLHRLRRVETDGARRELGEALAREMELAKRDASIEFETTEGLRISGDFDRQGLFAWLKRIRIERAELRGALREAEDRTAVARAVLAHRRVAETVAEEALAREVIARDVVSEKRDQATMEDAARALKRAAGAGRGLA